MLKQALNFPTHLIISIGLIAFLAYPGPSTAQSMPEAQASPVTIDPMIECMLSNLDMQKAEELGALVAASGEYWVPSPGGGMSDPYLLKHFDRTVPSQRKRFSAVVDAEGMIVVALSDGADHCGIDEDEFELGVGTLLGTENGTMNHEMVKRMPERRQKVWTAFRVVRTTLLNSNEFKQGYRRAVAGQERSKN